MLRVLIAKDLRRAWRNPVPLLVSVLLPFIITGLVGLAFAPREGRPAARISVALVDEDASPLTGFLRNGLASDEARQNLDVRLLDRAEAMQQVLDNAVAAVVVLPAGFSAAYLERRPPPPIQVIKNPAQGVPPALVEEGVQILVTWLNAVARLLGDDFAAVRELFAEDTDRDFLAVLADVSLVLTQLQAKLEAARDYLSPPLVQYAADTQGTSQAQTGTVLSEVFRFLLLGMMAMFLLMMADTALRDLYREARFRTFERYRTLRHSLLTFITGKAAFAFAVQWVGVVAFVGGGMVLFGITWERPGVLLILILAYTLFAAGFMGLLSALAGHERRADSLNSIVVMLMAAGGGCMFPPQSFPPFLRESVMPLLPTAWFAEATRALQDGASSLDWWTPAMKLVVTGVVGLVVATVLFRRRLERGVRL